MDDWLYIPSIITAALAFCSPGFAMLDAGSAVRYAPYSYAFGFTSCVLWIAFGVHYELGVLWGLSTFGAAAYAVYLAAFLLTSDAGDDRRDWLLSYVLGGSVAVLVTGILLRVLVNQAAFDNFCSTVACFASAAPLWNMGAVYRTKTTDSMPSPIVAGLMLGNAAVGTGRTVFLAESVNLNLAIPAGIALSSAVVQVLLHLACWCLRRRAPRLPSGVDQRPLLENQQTEDDHRRVSGTGQVAGDGRGLGLLHGDGLDMDNETLVDVTSLQKDIAQANSNLPLHQDGQLGQLDIDHASDKIVDLPLHQDGQHGLHEIAQANDKIVDLLSLRQDGQHGQHVIALANNNIADLSLRQDGQHEQQEITHANNEIKNLQQPQESQHGDQEY